MSKKTKNWIKMQEKGSLGYVESDVESSESDFASESDDDETTTTLLGTQIGSSDVPHDKNVDTIAQKLQEVLNSANSIQTVDDVRIENSTNVHIGNVTNINGNIQIIHTVRAHSAQRTKTKRRSHKVEKAPVPQPTTEEREERVKRSAFIDSIKKFKIPNDYCTIVPRNAWLAQTPLEEPQRLKEPVEVVIISHTATESSEKQAVNIGIIHDIQYFHVFSREWNDIAYNFLVGCDGNVYEGRGWGIVGAHTVGFNSHSIGISFIGCFMSALPSKDALNACRAFLKRGVKEGHLAADYRLLCHCQCRPTESPGRKLFEEIQKWDHFSHVDQETDEK